MIDGLDRLRAAYAAGRMDRRAFLRNAAALGLTASAAAALAADVARAATPKKGGTLRMGLGGGESTNSLDPALALSQVPFHVLRAYGEPLLNVNGDGTLDLRVAESFDSSPDAKTWTFRIRRGIEFHNGKTVTAEDVLETMRRHSDENTKSGALGVMRGIAAMRADGDDFIVDLETPNADLPYLMATYQLMIQPNGGRDDPAAGIGCGPYRVVSDDPGVQHTFERFPNYWDDSRGHFDGVEMIVINDTPARLNALRSGEVHIINQVEPKVAPLLARDPNVEVKNVAGRGHYVFLMHCDTAPFDNVDLRLALKYAINRDEMVEKILNGYGTVGNDFPINAAYPLFDETIPQRAYDPEKAAEHYRRSGHEGPITLRVAEVAFPGSVAAAQLYRPSAAAAGFTVEVRREPNDGYWSDVWNRQPFSASYWGGRPVQDQMYSTAYLSTADWNDTRFFNPRFDALLLEARGELDLDRRKALYSEMAMMVRDEGGLICPMFNDFIEGVRNEIAGREADGVWEVMNGLAPHKCWFA